MVLAYLGILVCVKDRHVNIFALPTGIALLVLILGCMVLMLFLNNGLLTALLAAMILAEVSILACYRARESLVNPLPIVIGLLIFILVCILILLFLENGGLTVLTFIMGSSLFGMLVCARIKNNFPLAKPLAFVLLGLIIVCVLIVLSIAYFGGEDDSLWENEVKYARAAAVILGRTLVEKYPGASVLIITMEKYERNHQQLALIAGLKEGFAGKISIAGIEFPGSGEDGSQGTDKQLFASSRIYTATDFNKIIANYPGCQLIVSLVGLPMAVENLSIWGMKEKVRPKLVLIFTAETGVTAKLKDAIIQGYLLVLSFRSGTKMTDEPCPRDPRKAFDQRYMIITKDNVEQMAAENANLFR
jgi:hypothetical protein